MTKNEAKKIFDRYNTITDVVSCPKGKTKVRDLLDLYAIAAANLYGIIRRDEFVEIFNAHNKEQTTSDEVYKILLPKVLKDKWYGFYKDYIVHYLALDNFDLVEYLEREQSGKPRYIPQKEDFLQYENEEYEDTDHWNNAFDYMCEAFGDSDNTFDCLEEIKEYLTFDFGINKIGAILEKFNIVLEDQKQAQEFFNKLLDAANNTRKWHNKGFTPEEMMKINAKARPKSPVFINQSKQTWPNEKCPCGSGKKYKKCCGTDEYSVSAHLNNNECELFYNTWYKLLLLVNKKLSIVESKNMSVESFINDDAQLFKISQKLWENPNIISEIVSEGNMLSSKEIQLFQSWEKYHIKGQFTLVKYEPEYTVLMHAIDEGVTKLYAVKGLKTSIAQIMQNKFPVMLETVLLPFEDKIIYDSFISSYPVSLGEGIMEIIEKDYNKAMEASGVVTRLG